MGSIGSGCRCLVVVVFCDLRPTEFCDGGGLFLYCKLTRHANWIGAWRDIANTYKPPINNSNAGYLLKTIYYKYLA